MTGEHPLAFFLKEALSTASEKDPVQGSVNVTFVNGRHITGQITWVSEDAQAFSVVRLTHPRTERGARVFDLTDCPRHYATAHVVEIYYNEAGA